MEWLNITIGIVVGTLLGVAAAAAFFISRRRQVETDRDTQKSRAVELDSQLQREIAEHQQIRREHADARQDVARLEERLNEKQRQFEEQKEILEQAKVALTDTFKSHAAAALKDNREQFMTVADERLKPIKELLEQHHKVMQEIDKSRQVSNKGLEEKILQIAASNDKLTGETSRLVTALRRSQTRGQWGEMQLRSAVEMAGMSEHCDFSVQVSVTTDDGRLRPDMVVKLPGGGAIPVDAKCVLDAYIDGLDPANDRAECLQRHANGMRAQMKGLAAKEYWKQFDRAPQIVVMFVPLESALTAALELDPNLHVEAMRSHVLIVSPTLLVALLRAVAYGWQQEDVAANARQIADTGRELYERIKTFADAYSDVGRKLSSAVQSYNKSVGSIESRMIPSARKLKELHATTEAEIDAPASIEIETRPFTAPELLPNFAGEND